MNNGGGIYVQWADTVEIDSSLIAGNSTYWADSGFGAAGGIFIDDVADTSIVNTTVSGNKAATGAGIFINHDPLYPLTGTASIEHSTVTANEDTGVSGGAGLWIDGIDTTLNNSIVYGNVGNSDVIGDVVSQASNMVGTPGVQDLCR